MKRNFHLIGEVKQHEIERLMEYLIVYDEINDVIYNESFRDLVIDTDYKDVADILEHCINELHIQLRFIERKAQKENVFEKRYFVIHDLDQEADQLFLKSYLENDPTIQLVTFNQVEKVLTVETSDPFVFNKISYVASGMNQDVEVEEIFSQKKFISLRFLTSMLVITLFVMFAALTLVTYRQPNLVTEIGWIGMYGILVTYFARKYYKNITEKKYYSYSLVVMVTTYVLIAVDYHLQALVGLVIAIWLDMLYKEVVVRIKDRLIDDSNSLVTKVTTIIDGNEVEMDVVDVQENQIVVYHSGDIIHFDGEINQGQGMVDTLLMSGNSDLVEVNETSLVQSGSRLVSGTINVKVAKNYYQSALYRLYSFNPKELKQNGYLVENYNRKDRLFAFLMVLVGMIIMVAGVILSDFGQHHFIAAGLAFMYLCYPLGILKLRPVLFQIFKQSTLKKGVIFLNEAAVNRFLELANSKQLNFKDDQLMKFHKGGYNNQEIVKNYTVIYEKETNLIECEKIANRIHQTINSNRKILFIGKVSLAALFLLSVFSFNFVVVVNLIMNLAIIYRTNRIINMIL